MEYLIFSPPVELAVKSPREWSGLEAKAYFNWFMSVWEERVDNFLGFLHLDGGQSEDVLLSNAQKECEKILWDEQFSLDVSYGRKLTNQGYALAADMGLLVARLLIKRSQGKVFWRILKKPKSELSYNLPVLDGFGTVHLDPIAGSIGDFSWILRGNKQPDAWVETFDFWFAKIA